MYGTSAFGMDGLIYLLNPNSTAQQRFIQERTAALTEARRQRAALPESKNGQQRERTTTTITTASSATPAKTTGGGHLRDNSYGEMPPATPSSSSSETAHQRLLTNPYELRHDRRYLKELPYPLPVDLLEIQRQNLRTLLSCRVFDSAVCSPRVKTEVPARVLEIGCGSGYWSAMCHDYFCSLGHKDVSFTGLDVAPLPPDLTKQGVKWTFVQHDLRRTPLPFDDEHFDFVMMKDISLVLPVGALSQKLIEESIRILRPGGTLEIWESDHVIRSLAPHPSILSRQHSEQKNAIETATFLISPATPFGPTQNRYLLEFNEWTQKALDRRKLPATPCAGIADILHQEPDSLESVGSRRIAIPFGEVRWERDSSKHSQFPEDRLDSTGPKGKERLAEKALTEHQAGLRQTALLTFVQMIESLEPLLKEINGKNAEEWAGWWAAMMGQLMDPSKSALSGECLEIGAWWATKTGRS